ncbi:MAG TPA: polysaccharide biosynthesis tyrosine autokinase [Pseudolysinimonas sp.]|nr:polysaccharide biosynthesis tyrosine autokinase [Pseudolysinimonas sp.]
MTKHEDTLTLARVALIIRRYWLVIVITTLLGGGGAFIISKSQTPLYEANSSVYFSLRQGDSSSDLNQGSAYTQAQMLSFAQLATSRITLQRVIYDLDLDVTSTSLARNITVTSPQNTVILNISVSSTSAERAAAIANSVSANLADVVVELAPSDDSRTATVSARVIDPAVTPSVQASPNKSRDTAIGVLLGLLAGIVGCILFTRLDTRVRSAEAVGSLTESPVLGQIGRLAPSDDPRPLMLREPNGEDAESFRRARAGMRFASVDKDVRVILVTSGIPAEGKTTVSVNLALAMAETNARVLLVDADLRRPRVASALALDGTIGLTTVLVDDVSLEEARRPYARTSLDLLLSGDSPPNPSELLSSDRMTQVIAELSAEYDIVIVDSAPVLSVADATLLAPHVDLILLVVNASKIRKAQLAKCIEALEVTGAHISGIVLNRLKLSKRRDDYYYGALPPEGEPRKWKLRRSKPSAEAPVDEPAPEDVAPEEAVRDDIVIEDVVVVEEIIFEEVVEEPVIEVFIEEPVAEEPVLEEPVAEEPVSEEPAPMTAASEPSVDAPAPSKPHRKRRSRRTPSATTAARSANTAAEQKDSPPE